MSEILENNVAENTAEEVQESVVESVENTTEVNETVEGPVSDAEGITAESADDSIEVADKEDTTVEDIVSGEEATPADTESAQVEESTAEEIVDEGSETGEEETEESISITEDESTPSSETEEPEEEEDDYDQYDDSDEDIIDEDPIPDEMIGSNVPGDTDGDGIPDELPDGEEYDPMPEKDGKWYISLGKDIIKHKFDIIQERLEKYDIDHVVTATGEILVGSYMTEEEALQARKTVLAKGLRGVVVKLN